MSSLLTDLPTFPQETLTLHALGTLVLGLVKGALGLWITPTTSASPPN